MPLPQTKTSMQCCSGAHCHRTQRQSTQPQSRPLPTMFPLSFPTVYVALISGATTRTTPHRRAYGAISRGPLLTGEHIGGHFSRGRIPDRPRIGVSDPASRDPGTDVHAEVVTTYALDG